MNLSNVPALRCRAHDLRAQARGSPDRAEVMLAEADRLDKTATKLELATILVPAAT